MSSFMQGSIIADGKRNGYGIGNIVKSFQLTDDFIQHHENVNLDCL